MIGYFKDLDNNSWSVQIGEGDDELILGSHPVIISTNSDGIFSPIKSRTCTIKLVVNEPLYELYSSKAQGVKVTVKKGVTTIFIGYLTPNIYNQQFHYLNELELEAVEAFSTLKYFKYELSNNTDNLVTFGDLVRKARTLGGYSSYSVRTQLSTDDGTTFNNIKINELNFFEDEGDKEAWDYYKIIEEICKYLGLSLVFINDEMYFVNYSLMESVLTLRGENVSANNLSLDDTFNKITITANHYPIDKIFDLNPFNYKYYQKRIVEKSDDEGITRFNYKISFPNEKWIMNQYHYIPFDFANYVSVGNWGINVSTMPTLQNEIIEPSELEAEKSIHRLYDLYSSIEAHCTEKTGDVTFNWEDFIVLTYMVPDFTIGETDNYYSYNLTNSQQLNGNKNKALIFNDHLNYPVLRLIDDIENYFTYSPINDEGITWLLFTGNVFFAEERDTMPSENSLKPRVIATQDENVGFDFLPIKLKIGNKYWNGTSWSTTESIFYVRVGDKVVNINGYNSFFNNVDISSGLNTKGYAIPIKKNDNVVGKVNITIYNPKMPVVRKDEPNGENYRWMSYPIIKRAYIKDFKISLHTQRTPQSIWDEDTEQKNEEDTEYTNTIDETFVNDFSSVELLINTQNQNKQISLSSPYNANGEYVTEINGKLQENNLVEMYSNHFNSPKRKINLTIEGYLNPTISYNYTWNDNDGSSGTFENFIVDTQEFDCEYNTNNINLIEL